jgi:DNA polymerase V
MRVNSDSMAGAGINRGDVVIVDRSLEPLSGKVVIAVLDGEMIIRKLEIGSNRRRLLPATSALAPIDVTGAEGFSIWGVVTYVIHSL